MTTRVTRESVQVGIQQDPATRITRQTVQVATQQDPATRITRMSVQVLTVLAVQSTPPWNVFPIK